MHPSPRADRGALFLGKAAWYCFSTTNMAKQSKFLRVPYALAVFGNRERQAVQKVLKTPQIVAGKKARALMIPSLLGNVPDLARLQKIAKKHKLVLIEDSGDTVGAKIAGKPTGAFTDVSTTSFYASHIITAAGEGGMLCVNDSVKGGGRDVGE